MGAEPGVNGRKLVTAPDIGRYASTVAGWIGHHRRLSLGGVALALWGVVIAKTLPMLTAGRVR